MADLGQFGHRAVSVRGCRHPLTADGVIISGAWRALIGQSGPKTDPKQGDHSLFVLEGGLLPPSESLSPREVEILVTFMTWGGLDADVGHKKTGLDAGGDQGDALGSAVGGQERQCQ